MGILNDIKDTFSNVRKKDYSVTESAHTALSNQMSAVDQMPLVRQVALILEQLGPQSPTLEPHLRYLAESIIGSAGISELQPMPSPEDTQAVYRHREYLAGMKTIVSEYSKFENYGTAVASIVLEAVCNACPETEGDAHDLQFTVPAAQFFHTTGHDLIDAVLGAFFHEEIIDTPLFAVWRSIILNNFEALYEQHRIKEPDFSAAALKGKLPTEALAAAIFGPLPLKNLFNFPIPFTAPAASRFKHQYVLGKTGSGKSVLLRYQIAHDLHAGHGVVVITPERDLIDDVLSYVPESRHGDVVHFDAADDAAPVVGFNPFALTDRAAMTQRAGELEAILIRTLGDMGVKMAPTLSNCIYALLATNGTLADVPKLLDLGDDSYRKSISGKLDEPTRDWFKKYESSTYYKDVYEPIINRLQPLLRPPLSATLATPSLDFSELLNHRSSIVLCNLSKLRGFQAEIVGQLLLATFQQTFFERDLIPEPQRLPYFFYMDEFQTYASNAEQSLKDFLTRARKYKVGIVMAHQNTDDIPSNLLSSIFGNCGTLTGMLMSSQDAPKFTKEAQLANFRGFDRTEAQLQNFLPGEFAIATPEMKQAQICRVPERPPFAHNFDQVEALKESTKTRCGVSATKPEKSTGPVNPPGDEPPKNPGDWEGLGYRLS